MLNNLVRADVKFDSKSSLLNCSYDYNSIYYSDAIGMFIFIDINLFKMYARIKFIDWKVDEEYLLGHSVIVKDNIKILTGSLGLSYIIDEKNGYKAEHCIMYINKEAFKMCNTFEDILSIDSISLYHTDLEDWHCATRSKSIFKDVDRLKPFKCTVDEYNKFIKDFTDRLGDVKTQYLKHKLAGYFS